MTEARWRKMCRSDIDDVTAVAEHAFPDHHEDKHLFEERLALFPGGCFILANIQEDVLGYCISYPWELGSIPALNHALGSIHKNTDTLFLHDLAICQTARGCGHTKEILYQLDKNWRRHDGRAMALVAVNSSVTFWESNGFTVHEYPALAEKLASYGRDALYMIKILEG